MKIKIVADSSADMLEFDGADFTSVPLTISTEEKEYVDDASLDVDGMITDLAAYKGKSHTSCPSTGQWLSSFDDADEVYVVTITSNLSGAYNSAMVAKQMYLEENPNAKVHVFDTLSTGPEMRLLVEKLAELINEGKQFEEVVTEANKYLKKSKLFFSLESLHNLAQNGRVSKISEIAAKVLSIRVIGQASVDGVLEILAKCRGFNKAFKTMIDCILGANYQGGKVRIAHANNQSFAMKIKDAILDKFKNADIKIFKCRGLCSYYAEEGGVLIGCECA